MVLVFSNLVPSMVHTGVSLIVLYLIYSLILIIIGTHPVVPEGAKKVDEALAEYEAGFEFARHVTLSVEDRRDFVPETAWQGGYRWFKAPNVICLEKIRALKKAGKI